MNRKSPDVIIVGPYPPPCGGMAHHIKALLELTRSEGIKAVVFDINRNTADDVIPIIGRKDLFKKIIKSSARVVHIHSDSFDLHYHAPVALLAAKASKKFAITSLHSGDTADYYEGATGYKKLLIRFCILQSDALILDNDSLKRFTKSFGRKKTTVVISPFIQLQFTFEDLPEELDKFVEGKRPLFVSCGNPNPVYQLDKVIDAFASLSKSFPSAGLVITETDVSNKEGLQRLKIMAKGLGIDNNVRFESGLSHGQFLNLLKRADAFIRFTMHDGDSLSVREALSLGVPVIATDTGTRPNGVVLVKPFDVVMLAEAMKELCEKELKLLTKPITILSEDSHNEFIKLYRSFLA